MNKRAIGVWAALAFMALAGETQALDAGRCRRGVVYEERPAGTYNILASFGDRATPRLAETWTQVCAARVAERRGAAGFLVISSTDETRRGRGAYGIPATFPAWRLVVEIIREPSPETLANPDYRSAAAVIAMGPVR